MEPIVNNYIAEATKKIIFKFKKDYISLLVETEKAYVYCEKYYDDNYITSSLSIKIFKQQNHKSLNFKFLLQNIFSRLLNNLENINQTYFQVNNN